MGQVTLGFRLFASMEDGSVRWLGVTYRGGSVRWVEQDHAASFPSREDLLRCYREGSPLGQYRVRPGTEVVIERKTETTVWEGLSPLPHKS